MIFDAKWLGVLLLSMAGRKALVNNSNDSSSLYVESITHPGSIYSYLIFTAGILSQNEFGLHTAASCLIRNQVSTLRQMGRGSFFSHTHKQWNALFLFSLIITSMCCICTSLPSLLSTVLATTSFSKVSCICCPRKHIRCSFSMRSLSSSSMGVHVPSINHCPLMTGMQSCSVRTRDI